MGAQVLTTSGNGFRFKFVTTQLWYVVCGMWWTQLWYVVATRTERGIVGDRTGAFKNTRTEEACVRFLNYFIFLDCSLKHNTSLTLEMYLHRREDFVI